MSIRHKAVNEAALFSPITQLRMKYLSQPRAVAVLLSLKSYKIVSTKPQLLVALGQEFHYICDAKAKFSLTAAHCAVHPGSN